jgi:hypothetical protein
MPVGCLRRTVLILSIHDILRSMQDVEWLQRAKICGQIERIWEAIYESRGPKGDEVSCSNKSPVTQSAYTLQVIEAMCLLYLANLVKSGSGLDLILRSHADSCESLVLGLLKVRDGPLDEVCRTKVTGLVS